MTTKQLSAREKGMQKYVADNPSPTTAVSPEDDAARIARNWDEIKKARINALKMRNPKGVAILDQELAAGRGLDFPADASFEADDFQPDGDFVPDKVVPNTKPASQGAVRASEPSMALIEQEADERGWENARREYIKQRGVLTPGKTQSQAVSEATGRRDPAETRQGAEAQHAIDTGELIYGDSAIYNVAKPAAAIAGFAYSGPLGASAAEALVRATAIGYNLNAALDKGMDPDRAAQLFVNELSKGAAVDTLFNFGAPVVGKVISKIPGLNRIADKIHAELQKRLGGPAPRPDLRESRIEDLAKKADTPERAAAVRELSKRVEGDYIPTPGQVAGEAGFRERRVYEAFPGEFQKQEEAMGKAAEQMRKKFVQPGSQPTQQKLGEQVDRMVDETVRATKRRLTPVFEEANRLNIIADFNAVEEIARKALQKDAEVVGKGKLTEAERNHLQQIIEDTRYQPYTGAEAALDFISIQKAMLRKLNPDGKPTPYFSTVVGDLTRAANDAFEEGANRMGKHAIVDKLKAARNDYRIMNEQAYQGAMKQVGIKGDHAPEDIGSYLWSNGKVTRIDELDELLGLARKEGVASSAAIEKMRRNVTRGFLQEAVRDVESAAKFTQSLSDPKRRATWEALTRGPEGQALKDGMAVLEQAAQMVTLPKGKRQSTFMQMPISRAAGGTGLGISWVTGALNPWLIGGGLTIAGTMRLMATAYVHGDKGTINLISKVLRANSTATAASAKALQELVPQLEAAAQKYNVTDFFLPKEEQSDEQLGPQSEAK